MKAIFLFCVLLWAGTVAHSQEKTFTVSGVVTDEKTKLPMPGASVFCENTTIGTVTNNEGKFFLRLTNGGYDLVFSYTGYETRTSRISNGDPGNDNISIELKEKDKSLNEVVVTGSLEVANGWEKYGNFFLDHFIGTTPNATLCQLQNKEVLKFYFYKKRNKLRVKATDDLVVVNQALGYKIKYQLDSFVYDYNTNISSYTGFPLFEEMKGTAAEEENWKKNRFNTYIGSRLHFMRCYFDSTLQQEGFSLELLDSTNQPTALKDPYDNKFYSIDSGDVVINIKGKLRVSYGEHVPDRKYLEENKFPMTTEKQISALDIMDGFIIEENGYFYEQSEVTNLGYWAWKKLAELLPYDYEPE